MRQVQDVEGRLPPKVPVVIKVPMSGYQVRGRAGCAGLSL